jgi:hypothetical protein
MANVGFGVIALLKAGFVRGVVDVRRLDADVSFL